MKTKSIFWTTFIAAILYLFAQAVYARENRHKTRSVKIESKFKTKAASGNFSQSITEFRHQTFSQPKDRKYKSRAFTNTEKYGMLRTEN